MSEPIGQWHNLKSLESGTVLFECKDGPYEPSKYYMEERNNWNWMRLEWGDVLKKNNNT